jgi:hypothetical protein
MTMSPALLGNKNDCAGEAQQEFTRSRKILIIEGKAIAEVIFSVYSKTHFLMLYPLSKVPLPEDKRALPGNL